MARISRHSKARIVERAGVENIPDAKRLARTARVSGKTINSFQRYPKFHSYLLNKRNQTNTCSLRVYQGNIYIWRGRKQTLVTAHPIPDRYKEEMEAIDNK